MPKKKEKGGGGEAKEENYSKKKGPCHVHAHIKKANSQFVQLLEQTKNCLLCNWRFFLKWSEKKFT